MRAHQLISNSFISSYYVQSDKKVLVLRWNSIFYMVELESLTSSQEVDIFTLKYFGKLILDKIIIITIFFSIKYFRNK